VIHLATAPKSNASYVAIDAALADVKSGHAGSVPKPLRDGHYPGAKAMGHGVGYKYPHSYPHAITDQQYLPDNLTDRQYYLPSGNGREDRKSTRLNSSHVSISYAVFCLKKKTNDTTAQ